MKRRFASVLLLAVTAAQAQGDGWTEFISGQRSSYSSAGSAKARGIDVTFDYPLSWDGVDAKRPNTLYQVTSERGKGFEFCNLAVKHIDAGPGVPITRSEIDEAFAPSGLKALVPSGSTFLNGKRTTIDGQPGAQIQFEQEADRAGIQMRIKGVMYPFIFSNALIALTCMVGDAAETPRSRIDERYKTWFPLFQQMANSVVINSKWKNRK